MFRDKFRFVLVLWLFVISVLAFCDRVNISIAGPSLMEHFGLSPTSLGIVMSAFNVGFSVTCFVCGFLVENASPRKSLTLIIILWSAFTFFTGLAWSLVSLLFIRVIFGVVEAPMFVCNNKFVHKWFKPTERGFATGLWLACIPAGIFFGNILSAWVVGSFGWRAVFYIFGIAGLGFAWVSWLILRDTPRDHPLVSRSELDAIETALQGAPDVVTPPASTIGQLMRNPWLWVLWFAYFCIGMFIWANFFWLPIYFLKTRSSDLMSSGIYAAIPWLLGMVSPLIIGGLSDRIGGNRCLWMLGVLVLTIPFVLVGVHAESLTLCLIGFSIATFFCYSTYGIIYVLPMELFEKGDLAKVTGIVMSSSAIGGVFAPVMVGYIYQMTASFNIAYYVFVVGLLLAAVLTFILNFRETAMKRSARARMDVQTAHG